jgi:hypothetical protein
MPQTAEVPLTQPQDKATITRRAWNQSRATPVQLENGSQVEETIDLLGHGLEVETLLELICLRLNAAAVPTAHDLSRFREVVKTHGVP